MTFPLPLAQIILPPETYRLVGRLLPCGRLLGQKAHRLGLEGQVKLVSAGVGGRSLMHSRTLKLVLDIEFHLGEVVKLARRQAIASLWPFDIKGHPIVHRLNHLSLCLSLPSQFTQHFI